MAEFRQDLQSFRPSPPFPEMDVNVELMNQFAELNPSMLENFNFPVETLFAHQQQEFPANCAHNNLSITFHPSSCLNAEPVSHTTTSPEDVFQESKKRKVMEHPNSSSQNTSPAASATGFGGNTDTKKKKSLENGKKGRSKSEEVVHVRARRGQATDSHSLAERVRREKINNRMKCLQNLVPGCHKTMGMSGMLDEIINYVHSLQNQVEFLSMELAAASSYDLKLETVQTEKVQGTNSHEAKETEQWARERYGDHTCFQSTWPL